MFVRAMVRDTGQEREARAGDGWLGNPAIAAGPATVDQANTITVAAIQAGIWQRDGISADRIDTLPTAALILAALPFMSDGDCYPFMVSNIDASHKITVATANGITLSGTVDVLLSTSRFFLIRRTSSTTIDVIGL